MTTPVPTAESFTHTLLVAVGMADAQATTTAQVPALTDALRRARGLHAKRSAWV